MKINLQICSQSKGTNHLQISSQYVDNQKNNLSPTMLRYVSDPYLVFFIFSILARKTVNDIFGNKCS